jgi:hypothetical protein
MGPNRMVLICVGLPEHMSIRILSTRVTYFKREITIDCESRSISEILFLIARLI